MSSMQMPWLLTMQMSWLLTMQMSWLQTQQMPHLVGFGVKIDLKVTKTIKIHKETHRNICRCHSRGRVVCLQ